METVDIVRRNINRLRHSKRISILAFASASGVSKSNIWKIETGRTRSPSINTIETFANALGVSMASLFVDDRTLITQEADYITTRYLSLNRADRLKMHKLINVVFDGGSDK